MSVMNVDYDKLRIILMPHVLRQGGLLEAVFRTAYAPLKRIYASFTAYVGQEEQERIYGPTVKQLRQAIADHLGCGIDSVEILDVDIRTALDIRRVADGVAASLEIYSVGNTQGQQPQSLWSDDMVWWNREFVVRLPRAYRATYIQKEIETILDRWKMASSRYTITYKQ